MILSEPEARGPEEHEPRAAQRLDAQCKRPFCFTFNWTGGTDVDVKKVFSSYVGAVADVLGEAAKTVA